MINKNEWIKCSAVAIGFYIIVYIVLARSLWGYTNLWLIGGCIVFTISDILALRWWANKRNDKDSGFNF